MSLKSYIVLILMLSAGIVVPSTANAKSPPPPPPSLSGITAKAAIVMDNSSGKILGFKYADQRLPMASTTKIMTALLTIEAIKAGKVKRLDKVRVYTYKSNGKLFKKGTREPLLKLLMALMVRSANEAALSLAYHVSKNKREGAMTGPPLPGDYSNFIKRMNRRAKQLKMVNTHFENPHGRDPEDMSDKCSGNQFKKKGCKHYSTARDLALLTRYALTKPLFKTLVKARYYYGQKNTNYLFVWNNTKESRWKKSGWKAYGVKTGTTNRGGHCLVSAAKKGKKDVIVVVLGSTIKWERKRGDDYWNSNTKKVMRDGKEINNSQRFEDTLTLFKWADKKLK